MSRQAGIFSDPANPQAAPGYGVVIGVGLRADLRDAKGDGIVVEHCFAYSRNATHICRAACSGDFEFVVFAMRGVRLWGTKRTFLPTQLQLGAPRPGGAASAKTGQEQGSSV